MNKEPKSSSSYPLGETYFTKYKNTPLKLRDVGNDDAHMASLFGTEDQQLAGKHRISHPYVSEQMTTTNGQQNRDPEDGLPWSRNRIVKAAIDDIGYQINETDADNINTKLRRDSEEISLTVDAIATIDGMLEDATAEQETAKRRRKHELAAKVLNLVNDKRYLEKRAEWLSGIEYTESEDGVIDSHDIITQRILTEELPDGRTPKDMLHDQALRMARDEGVEVRTDN